MVLQFIQLVPEDLKQKLRDRIVEFVAQQAENMPGGHKIALSVRQLSSQAAFTNAFEQAFKSGFDRFKTEYLDQDEDLVAALISDQTFWQSKDVRQALMTMINRPGAWLMNERDFVAQRFADVLPQRVNRQRVDKAVSFLLRCVLEELWTLPGVKEIREIYSLQFQKLEAEVAQQQVALLQAQLRATTQLSTDLRQGLLQLTTSLEQHLLTAQPAQALLPSARPYHNLFRPDYTRFIGRQQELEWLHKHLSPEDRAWQMVITGIGGVGKSALALAIAHEYREHYQELSPEERFETIIWISAKEEVLTAGGRGKSSLGGRTFRTLEDMYTTIAQTLEREDITRAIPEQQDHLVQKALSAQRTLLIVDNLETVTDERVQGFLYYLPTPVKCIITSREWVDVAAVLRLTGLPSTEAMKLIAEEAKIREVHLDASQQQRLFERTGGLPLPIKLSIARMASGETFDQVLRWLGDVTGSLPEYSVKGQIDRARQLDSNTWKLLLACSLFDKSIGASREALGAVADLSLADRDDGLTMLQRLSLVNSTGDDRFWLLPLVQGYAGAELVKADFSSTFIQRWLDWLLDFSRDYGTNLNLHLEKVHKFESEYLNLLGAIRWCREHENWEILLRLADGTWFYPYLVNLFSELQEILESALQACKALRDERQEVRFLCRLGELCEIRGQDEKALSDYLARSEQLALTYHEDLQMGWICNNYASIFIKREQFPEAEQHSLKILEIGEQLNSLDLKAVAAHQLARIYSAKQEFDKALEWIDCGEQWAKEVNWTRGLAWLLYRRGSILLLQGNATAAEVSLRHSLSMAAGWNERRLMAFNKYCYAKLYLEAGQFELAVREANEVYDLCERLGMATELGEVEELLRRLPKASSKP